MKQILFISNGMLQFKKNGGISGGTMRLFEVIRGNHGRYKIIVFTSPAERKYFKLFKVPVDKMYVNGFQDKNPNGILSNSLAIIYSIINLPKDIKLFNGIVYSSCEHLYDVLPALIFKLSNRCQWYAVYHWVEDFPWREKRGGTPFLPRYIYWLNRWLSGFIIKHFSDKILAVSDQTKEKLVAIKKINSQKIKAVYCGVNLKKIDKVRGKYDSEKEKKYDAVFMKRLHYGKGIFDLMEIWKLVCQRRKNARLAIIGDGPTAMINEINNFIVSNHLEKNIFLLGGILNFEKKFRVMNSSKLFILPSHEENWAIVIGEAMAIQVPVVAYNLKEIVPIWQDNVTWVDFPDRKQFATKIIGLLSNKNQRKTLAHKAYEFVKQYSWDKIAKNEFE